MRVFLLTLCLCVAGLAGLRAEQHTVSGYVSDRATGESLISASVFDLASGKGMVTNPYGFYSLTLPGGTVRLRYSYVGYAPQVVELRLDRDTALNVRLDEDNLLQEVTVTGHNADLGLQGAQMSAVEVPVAQLKAVPALLGETDVVKALQLMPGVQDGTEGSAGFYVRGGGPDENLFLLDGVPVYNINHLGGFFSVFNGDAVKNVTLYKGGFPARFGGRLSSVLDVRMKDGNNQRLAGSVSVGLISAKLNLEGPLFSPNTTFNISARRTYFDVLAQPVLWVMKKQEDYDRLSAGYYFYDLNAKVSHRFSDRDRLYLSFYMGDDAVYTRMKDEWGSSTDEMRVDFALPRSVSGMRADADARIAHTDGALKIVSANGREGKVFYKTYYRKEDLYDNRYDPAFSPKAYNGQTIRARYRTAGGARVRLFCEDLHGGKTYFSEEGATEWKIEVAKTALIGKIGLAVRTEEGGEVRLTSDLAGTATLYDVSGQLVSRHALEAGDNVLPAPGSAGYYLLRVVLDNGRAETYHLQVVNN